MKMVIKANGKLEKFDERKIQRTCERAGADSETAKEIAREVYDRISDETTTKQVLKITLQLLRKEGTAIASRYDLKGALLRLGPAGFNFEQFLSKVLYEYGYVCKTNVILKGDAVDHEIDILASKEGKNCHIEAKYHNFPGIFTGIKDALYTYARFLDLKAGYEKGRSRIEISESWLATNTKFSNDAIAYSKNIGVKLLGWKYPEDMSLEKMIHEKKLFPVTSLTSVTRNMQEKLAENGIFLCKEIIKLSASGKMDELSRKTGISKKKLAEIAIEAEKILS